jgi:hypothetical protein
MRRFLNVLTRGRRRMGWSGILPLLAAVGIGWLPATAVHGQGLPLTAAEYPAHTHLTYYPTWTNQQFDCNFGMVCDSGTPEPYLHFFSEDQLHRTGGWAIWGEWQDDRMGFELYSSVYAGGTAAGSMPWNQNAATDEQTMLVRAQLARPAKTIPSVLPDGVQGGAFAYYLSRPYWHVLFLTAWWGTDHEVEAAALYPTRLKSEARRYLIEQVRTAIRVSDLGA